MANLFIDFPDPLDPTVGYGSTVDLANAIASNAWMKHPEASPFSIGATAGWYHFTQWAYFVGDQNDAPFIQISYVDDDGGGDNVFARFHFQEALKGTFDPLLLYDPDTVLYHLKHDATAVDEIQSRGLTLFFEQWVDTLAAALRNSGLLEGTFTGDNATLITATDGIRAGSWVGIKHDLQYNPTASEAAAGIREMWVNAVYTFTFGGSDEVNFVGVTSGAANVAINGIPQVIVQGSAGDSAWTDLSTNVGDINTNIQDIESLIGIVNIFAPGVVTNSADLGAPGALENEPVTPTREVFASASPVPALVGNPSAVGSLTTGAGLAWGVLANLGSLAAQAIQDGTLANIASAANSLLNLGDLDAIVTELQGVNANLLDLETSVTAVSLDFERLVNLMGSPPGEPTPPARHLDALTDLAEKLRLLAETRQELTLRAKGIEVECMTGALVEEP